MVKMWLKVCTVLINVCFFFVFFFTYLNWHLDYSHIHTCHAHSITFQQTQKHYQDAND